MMNKICSRTEDFCHNNVLKVKKVLVWDLGIYQGHRIIKGIHNVNSV
jgi:hypothetical protein